MGALFSTLPSAALARPVNLDFDQGIDVPKVNGFLSPLPVAARRADISSQASGKDAVSAPGFLFGPWQPKIFSHEGYKKAQEYPPLIEFLSPPVRDPLKVKWQDIEKVRGALLADAAILEPVDQKLYQAGVALDEEADRLNGERDDLHTEIDQYNSQCAGRPSTPSCERWRADLVWRSDVLQGKIARHNENIVVWRRKAAELEGEGKKLDERIVSWGATVGAFAMAVETALSDAGVTTVRVQAQGDDIPRGGKSRVASVVGNMCVEMGEQLIVELRDILTSSELIPRGEAFGAAANWMRNVAAPVGGIPGPSPSKSFRNANPVPKNARIDVEVMRGRAFVFCQSVGK